VKKIKLNVYPVIPDMEERIGRVIDEAIEKGAKTLEIAYGPSGEGIKKRILNYLGKKEVRALYSRLEKTEKGWGRVYLHFR
jgi:hypothetical protein